ncbi:unnamed protein product [Rotaria sp. Silwood1]|nr:unnamed protein product [Rotaria sp. Silwood1]
MNDVLFTTGTSNMSMESNLLANIIIDGNHSIMKDVDEVVVSDSNDYSCKEEETFYSKVYAYKEKLKYPEKVMISLSFYDKIIVVLQKPNDGKKTGIDAKFHCWCKKHFKIDITSGSHILCLLKDGRRVVVIESYYTILKNIHEKTGHGGRDKMRYEFNQHYYWLPSQMIDCFLQCCISCQVRKSIKNPVVSTAIISIGFMTRLQMDLIDLRTRPDKDFQWILHCRDHYSKYSWAF